MSHPGMAMPRLLAPEGEVPRRLYGVGVALLLRQGNWAKHPLRPDSQHLNTRQIQPDHARGRSHNPKQLAHQIPQRASK